MTRRLAVIPARGGSKRIAHKNLRQFGGQPAFTHILGAAAQSELFDIIHVSTDDEAIAQAAALAGFPPGFDRDANLADDHTPIRSVVSWVLRQYEERGEMFDTVALLYATAFFVTPEALTDACETFESGDRSQPLLGVVEVGTPLEKLFRLEDGLLATVDAAKFGARTQDLTPVFRDAGAFGVFDAASLLSDGDGAQPLAFRAFPLAPWVGIDIDTEEDWAFAERLHAGGMALQFKDRS
tara:strand:- start:365 stop:1081 length:717 start_codon:yes stop_codon:yes gene_type:complete